MKPRGRHTSGALAWAVALTLAMLVGAGAAAGFSCAPRDPREAPNEAMASGKWKVVEGVIEAESIFGIRLRVERTYERTYAAEVARTITLPGQSNANRVGQPWTFYIQRNLVAYDYTDCGGSHGIAHTRGAQRPWCWSRPATR